MTDRTNYSIEKIGGVMFEMIKSLNISQNVFVGNRPSSTSAEMADFIVASINGTIRDMNGFGKCTCLFQFFAKDMAHGIADSAKLSTMHDKFVNIFPIKINDYLFDYDSAAGARDTIGYHANLYNINCMIDYKTN